MVGLPGNQPRFAAPLRETLPGQPAHLDGLHRVRRQRGGGQTHEQEPADALEPLHGPALPNRTGSCTQWYPGKRLPGHAPRLPAPKMPAGPPLKRTTTFDAPVQIPRKGRSLRRSFPAGKLSRKRKKRPVKTGGNQGSDPCPGKRFSRKLVGSRPCVAPRHQGRDGIRPNVAEALSSSLRFLLASWAGAAPFGGAFACEIPIGV
jgi:hypothetical protein